MLNAKGLCYNKPMTRQARSLPPYRPKARPSPRHRRQVALQIGLPLALGVLLAGALGVAAALSPRATAQGGSAAVILLAGLCGLAGLPVLVLLIAAVVVLHKAPAALLQGTARLQRTLQRVERLAHRLSDRASAPWLSLASLKAGLQRLRKRTSSHPPGEEA